MSLGQSGLNFSGVVSHPRDLQVLQYVVSFEFSSLTNHSKQYGNDQGPRL